MNELHTYCFYVDGMRMLDPSNVYMIRDIATYTNYFLVDGELSQNYFVCEVPHGTVSKVWYPSPTLGMERRRMRFTHLPVMKTAINNIRYYTCCMVREVMKMPGVSWVEPFRYLTT